MSADYKNLFDKKKDYSNLFSKSTSENITTKISNEQGTKMSYKNLFDNAEPKNEVKRTPSIFPERQIDPRVKGIQEIDPKISTHSVINWIDNFDDNLKKLSTTNQDVSQKELDLAMEFTNGRLCVESLFNEIKFTVEKLKGPKKKTGILSKLLSSNEEFKLTQEIITEVIQEIKKSLEDFKAKAKYNSSMFLKSQMRKIESDIFDIKSDLDCAKVAATYLVNQDDFKGPARLEKVKQLMNLVNLSELQLKNTYDLLEKDMEAYENLKDSTIPFLYVKIQSLMSSTLDSEALNVINDINKL